MKTRDFSIAIVGAGIGGLTAAGALRRLGIEVRLYEQAQKFAHIGAGIQLTANATKVLRGLGLEEGLRRAGFAPELAYHRESDTGAVTNVVRMGRELEERYGAPDLMLHRGALHAALAALVPAGWIHFDKRLVGLARSAAGLMLSFADGSQAQEKVVIGADGVHSVVRELLFGADHLRFSGLVGHRATFPAALLGRTTIDDRCKWWGPDRYIVHYYTMPRREEIYFIATLPESEFDIESWSMKGDVRTLCEAFSDFHPQARAILAASPEVRKWALADRDPLPKWGEENIVLLGDACHPVTPSMAQGAASSMEDAVVLSRCLATVNLDGVARALRRYEAIRKPRTSRIQLANREDGWLRFKTDTDWLYSYDAWKVPVDECHPSLVPSDNPMPDAP